MTNTTSRRRVGEWNQSSKHSSCRQPTIWKWVTSHLHTHTHTYICVPCGRSSKFAEFKFRQCTELSKFTTYYFTIYIYIYIVFEGSINLFLLVSNVTSSWLFHRHPSEIKHEEMVVLTLPHYPLKPSTYSILFTFSPCRNHPLQKKNTRLVILRSFCVFNHLRSLSASSLRRNGIVFIKPC